MKVKNIMTPSPICCTSQTDVCTIARLMRDNDCGAIPVVKSLEDRRLVGIVTDRDVTCRIVAGDQNPQELTAQECMSFPVITIGLEAGVEDCYRTMEHYHVRRIPVVDAQGACCGLVSLPDIAHWGPSQETAVVVRALSHLHLPVG